jgi:hypothetical protein
VTIRNLISWMDTPDSFGYSSGSGPVSLQVTYSDIQGGTGLPWFGTGCIDEDPLFVDATAHNFGLQWGSPCIDTGDPTSPPDLDGTQADMGAVPYLQDIEPVPAMSVVSGLILLIILGRLFYARNPRS